MFTGVRVVVSGLAGSGKSTVVRAIAEALQDADWPVVLVDDNGEGQIEPAP